MLLALVFNFRVDNFGLVIHLLKCVKKHTRKQLMDKAYMTFDGNAQI